MLSKEAKSTFITLAAYRSIVLEYSKEMSNP